jgi:tyrosine-protein phosphatase SIW14
MGISLGLILTVVPFVYYRMSFGHAKRLRAVTEGKVYRSGCLTAQGFRDAIERLKIRTIINLMDEAPDPSLPHNFFDRRGVAESEVCKELGVNFVFIGPDLIARNKFPGIRPKAIDQFLQVMDNPANYPVLIHCRAGLHRTGCVTAIYRMEYENWSVAQALQELKGHGFGEYASTSFNDYITQYVLTYEPGHRKTLAARARPMVKGVHQ